MSNSVIVNLPTTEVIVTKLSNIIVPVSYVEHFIQKE